MVDSNDVSATTYHTCSSKKKKKKKKKRRKKKKSFKKLLHQLLRPRPALLWRAAQHRGEKSRKLRSAAIVRSHLS